MGVLSFTAVESMEGLETGGQPDPVSISGRLSVQLLRGMEGRGGLCEEVAGTSYPSQAGGRNSVCGGAAAGGNQGGEGTRWCCEQKPGQRESGAAVTALGSLLCHIAAQWIDGESRRGCCWSVQFSSVTQS